MTITDDPRHDAGVPTPRRPEAPTAAIPPTGGVTPRTAALIAGVSYVALFALGIFANFFVREGLIADGDAQATATSIADSIGLFRAGMVAFLVIFLLDVVVSWALYIVFRSADRDLARLAAWFRLVYTVFLGVAVIFFFQAVQLLDGPGFLDVFTAEQRNAQALVALDAFNSTWLIGLAGFGLHLVVLGVLIVRSAAAPRALAYVLLAAGAAYVIDTTAHTILADYADVETLLTAMVAVPAVIAEGWFGLWLLLRAGRGERAHRPV